MTINIDKTSFFANLKILPIIGLVAKRYMEYRQTGVLAVDEIDIGLVLTWLGLSRQQGVASVSSNGEQERKRRIARAEKLEAEAKRLRGEPLE